MPKPLRRLAIALIFLEGLAVMLGTGLLAYRAVRQHLNGRSLMIRSPNGIDEGFFVPIGGIDQWVQIRGVDRNNPVLLVLNGGPGGSLIAQTDLFLSWEKYFTVVFWDQRGEGRTFGRSGRSVAGTMTIDRMAADGIEVSEFLRAHLHREKITIVCHSWGSILGIVMAKRRPDLFYAYVGTGQVVTMRLNEEASYFEILARARSVDNSLAVNELESIGPPPYRSIVESGIKHQWSAALMRSTDDRLLHSGAASESIYFAPRISFKDISDFRAGYQFSQQQMAWNGELMRVDLSRFGLEFSIPMFFIQGTEDMTTPTFLVDEYFFAIRAPRKEIAPIEGGGHLVMIAQPDMFLAELVKRVYPVIVEQGGSGGAHS